MSATVGSNIVGIATTFFGTLVYLYLGRDLLYKTTNDDALWFLFFFLLFTLFTLFSLGYSYVYKPTLPDDTGDAYRSRQLLFIFLQITTLLTSLRFLSTMIAYGISITPMTVLLYYTLFVLGITGVFVLVYKLQQLLE
jgi:hypothetical protein